MELLCRWHELWRVRHGGEDNHCRINDLRAQVLTDLIEILHVIAQDLLIDSLQNVFLGGEARGKGQVARKPQVDLE